MTFTSLSKKFISAIQSQLSTPQPVIEVKGRVGLEEKEAINDYRVADQ